MVGAEDDNDDDGDAYDIFESALETLFDHHQSASGNPGSRHHLRLSESLVLQYRIPQIEASCNNRLFAHYQWDAGQILAAMLFESTLDSRDGLISIPLLDSNVVELGAGSGLPGLACAKLGAAKVCITDYPDEGIIKAIEENITLNDLRHNTTAKGLDWGNSDQLEEVLACSALGGYDLILCADVLWLSVSHDSLLRSIVSLLEKSSSSRVLVVSGFHTGRRALLSFFRKAILEGLCPDRNLIHDGVFEQHARSGFRRPWSGVFPFPTLEEDKSIASRDLHDNMDDYNERSKWLLCVSLRWRRQEG